MNTKLIDSLAQIIQSLSLEEKTMLKTRVFLNISSEETHTQVTDWTDDLFIGMWKDRVEMEDSSQWVRIQRQQEWG